MISQENEKEILLQVAKGSEGAFRELLKEYADLLLTYLVKLIKDRELAEEIVQDIFVQVWETRDSLHNIRNFRGYLFIISRNHALKIIDKMLTEKKRFDKWVKADLFSEDETVTEDRLHLVEQAIKQLPPQQYKVWVMSRREGKQYAEIAAELKLSRETVKSYLKLATASITEYITKRVDLLLLIVISRLS